MADEQKSEIRIGAARRRSRQGPASRPLASRRRPVSAPLAADAANRNVAAPAVVAVKSRSHFLPPECTADEAFRLTLTHCKWHILANVPAVVEAQQIEGVHQLRVALRRLRVALAAFGHDFRTPAIESLRMRAKILARGLGPARDMDVFLTELVAPAEADASAPAAFAALRERAEARRNEAWDAALREASGLAFQSFLHDLTAAIDQRQWYDFTAEGDAGRRLAAFATSARTLADTQLSHRLNVARKKARKLATLSETERHQLRIALKKLRYSVEFFAALYPDGKVASFVKRLVAMQDILGLLQDVAVARTTLHQLSSASDSGLPSGEGDVCFAAGTVYGWHLAHANKVWADAKVQWKRLIKHPPFWEAT